MNSVEVLVGKNIFMYMNQYRSGVDEISKSLFGREGTDFVNSAVYLKTVVIEFSDWYYC